MFCFVYFLKWFYTKSNYSSASISCLSLSSWLKYQFGAQCYSVWTLGFAYSIEIKFQLNCNLYEIKWKPLSCSNASSPNQLHSYFICISYSIFLTQWTLILFHWISIYLERCILILLTYTLDTINFYSHIIIWNVNCYSRNSNLIHIHVKHIHTCVLCVHMYMKFISWKIYLQLLAFFPVLHLNCEFIVKLDGSFMLIFFVDW